jgi:phosphatidylglycerol---prolipoprotein diacylglyceryl transferase
MCKTLIDFGITIPLGSTRIPLAIHSFGLMIALAFLACMYLIHRELVRKKLDPELASSMVFAAAVGGFFGAKLYSAVQLGDLSTFFSNAGFVWYGGLIGGSVAVWFTIYRSSNPMLSTMDAIAPALIIGYGIGRIGCLLSGDGDYGPPSNLPWAMPFPESDEFLFSLGPVRFLGLGATVPTPADVSVHPTPLYETGMSFIAGGLLWAYRKQKEGTPGWLFGGYLILAGSERFLAEFWRRNAPVLFGWMTTAQIFSLLLILIGGGFLYWVTHRTPAPAQAANATTPASTRKRRKRRR